MSLPKVLRLVFEANGAELILEMPGLDAAEPEDDILTVRFGEAATAQLLGELLAQIKGDDEDPAVN